jgi:hypothetical protein
MELSEALPSGAEGKRRPKVYAVHLRKQRSGDAHLSGQNASNTFDVATDLKVQPFWLLW